jgi:OmpA-OmpF porin, OOP family
MRRTSWLAFAVVLAVAGTVGGQPGRASPAALPRSSGSFTIPFGPASSTLTPEAIKLLDRVVEAIKAAPGKKVVLAGHTDSTLNEADAMKLAQAEVLSVRSYLIEHGAAADIFKLEAYGALHPVIQTPRGIAEPQNRRVEILIGASSSW